MSKPPRKSARNASNVSNASKAVTADSGGKENKSKGKQKKGAADKKTRKPPTIQWTKEPSHHLTDELLTLVEAKPLYRQGFGFDKGQAEPVPTSGKTLADLCTDLAAAFFDVQDDDENNDQYMKNDLPELAKVVKNRIASLKTQYQNHRQALGSTGHGLVVDGKENEIAAGPIANAWDAIIKKFPWYKRMHALMGTSPIVNRSAVAHSGTRVDLGVLDRDGTPHDGPIMVSSDSSSDDESKLSGWSSSSPPRRAITRTDSTDKISILRKTLHERIEEMASEDRQQRLKLTEVKEHQKTARTTARTNAKYEHRQSLELARMEHERREAEAQRQHQLFMLDRQIQLEALRQHQHQPQPATPNYGVGAPAYGAPPPDMFLDPSFRTNN
ncbi:hypothetical protein K438DRAFT_1981468 [Mycena galopus ATCC 62051]|nr:hypothetical protein K438DRAFT_1981468 [Mycena galopus ATCC 62051]